MIGALGAIDMNEAIKIKSDHRLPKYGQHFVVVNGMN
jgi:hypothetical protein